ncbi:MAG: TraB/GumN family protein [Proteobacteria bacterium]|nr:TraB/GumN family protein [Pseudomonadota bacterium]
MAVKLRGFLKIAFALLFALLAPRAFAEAPQPVLGKIAANPALWTVHGPKGTAYLFGSIHILPPNMEWRTPRVAAALKAADTFVFEIPMDDSTKAEIANFVRENAFLPKNLSLPTLLNDEARKDYRDALAISGVSPAALADKRPWFAALVIEVGYMGKRNLSPNAGVDRQVYADAVARGVKNFRALETPEEQFRLLMPGDRDLEIKEFDESLKDVLKDKGELGNLIDAWAEGDETRLGKLMNEGLKADPRIEKALFADRNARWVRQIAAMLNENHTYFITVGAGHLAGPNGVPAMLRKRGFKVDGP